MRAFSRRRACQCAFVSVAALALFGCEGTVEGPLGSPDAKGDAGGADARPVADASAADSSTAAGPDAAPAGPDAAMPTDATFTGTLAPGTSTLTVAAAGQSRSVLLHAPAAVASQALPLVIALHGNGDTSANFVAALGLQALAESDGFVLAAPQGITQSFVAYGQQIDGVDWDAYRTVADGNIDLPLLDALLGQLEATGSIDQHRAMVFGYSQGGYMSFRWGMEAAAGLSCTAVAAAANPMPGSNLIETAARKIPVALQIGTSDFAISNARSTRDELNANGNPVSYNEIAGAGHVPFPGDPRVPLDWCRAQTRP